MRPRHDVLSELALLGRIFAVLDSYPLEQVRTGWCTEEWKKWQQGYCGAYAEGLMRLDPSLRLMVTGTTDDGDPSHGWDPAHFYVTDDRWAYDSAGRHELPYYGIDGDCDYIEEADIGDWEMNSDEDLEAAMAHAIRNDILAGRYPLTAEAALHEGLLRESRPRLITETAHVTQ